MQLLYAMANFSVRVSMKRLKIPQDVAWSSCSYMVTELVMFASYQMLILKASDDFKEYGVGCYLQLGVQTIMFLLSRSIFNSF